MAHRLAIVEVDDETGQITMVQDHGPCTVAEFVGYNTRTAQWFEAAEDVDTLINGILDFCEQYGIVGPKGVMTNGWDYRSFIDFVQRNINQWVKTPESNYKDWKPDIPGPAKLLVATFKAYMVGKKGMTPIAFNMDDLVAMATRLHDPMVRQLLRDADRRNRLRPVMLNHILVYENPPNPN